MGGRTIAIRTTRSNGSPNTNYLHRDHLGSVDVITDESGNEVDRLSYDAHGKRRGLAWTADDSDDLLTRAYTTDRGFTGHEHLDHLALIHMNGRVFDPIIGRFISADPHIQFNDNSQSYNRYSYVLNNLLSATDPSGFFLKKLAKKVGKFFKQNWRALAAVAITTVVVITGGALAAPLGGFVAGLITGRGDLRAGLIGAATATVFVGVGSTFAALGRAAQSAGAFAQNAVVIGKIVAHGAVGGLSSVVNGGRFSDGFYSTAFTQALAGDINGIDAGNQGVSGYRIAAAAIVGGTASEISGGKFANGAVTAAFARAFNDELETRLSKRQARLLGKAAGEKKSEIRTMSLNEMRETFPDLANEPNNFSGNLSVQNGQDNMIRSLSVMQVNSMGVILTDGVATVIDGAIGSVILAPFSRLSNISTALSLGSEAIQMFPRSDPGIQIGCNRNGCTAVMSNGGR